MTIEEVLHIAGAEMVSDIKSSFEEKGLNDTKAAMDSLEYMVAGHTIIITGLARVLLLEFGRKAGQMPPVEPIQRWVERKLGIDKDKSKGVAYAIALKIKDHGTDILTDRAKGLQIELTLDLISKKLLSLVTKNISLEITSGIHSLWSKGERIKLLD